MQTELLGCSDEDIAFAAQLIKKGEVVGMPTETVYGLASNALDPNASKKIYAAKGRPSDNPLIVHICELDMINPLVKFIPDIARECAEKFWSGPLTMVLPKSDKIPFETSGGLDTVGIRFPANKTACKLIKASGVPLAAPSANRSGSPSPTCAKHVFEDMNGRIPAILDDGSCSIGVESTVICFEGENAIRILRPGFISAEDFMQITDKVYIDKGVLHSVSNDEKVASPGMKYKHYSPNCDVTIIECENKQALIKFAESLESNAALVTSDLIENYENLKCRNLIFGATPDEQAKRLFDLLRELDELKCTKAYFTRPLEGGVGMAVLNRLLRAAAFKVIKI